MSQRIIITGGSGFIGGHLCKALINDGYEVTVIDILPPARVISGAKYEIFDVREEKKLEKVIVNADAIFHFAATVSVPLCEENIVEGYSNNVLGTLTVLNAILKCKNFPRFFFSSSAAVYSTASNESVPLCEEECVMPHSHYAFQKRTAEKLIKLFFEKYKIPSLVFRFFNVYGPFQKKDSPYSGVITIFLNSLHKSMPLIIHGDGLQTRDFIFVDDIVSACRKALEVNSNELDGKILNLGTGISMSILELADKLMNLIGNNVQKVFGEKRIGDVRYSRADITLAKKVLGFSPNYSIDEGLKKLIKENY